ncbi:hypothetical protein Vadar_032494 [Vaccinium darrowii]|uniref:Uncharacterized protein n=1 Tax=Vaccinium darrowii TaxID=229202 RepID=A0ACB7Y4Y0_9ERIC|nr:hypothetical protein Vadar_032494 [Vaccinium darrowii]
MKMEFPIITIITLFSLFQAIKSEPFSCKLVSGPAFFKLAVQWPNSFCNTDQSALTSCKRPIPQRFTVRRLWAFDGSGKSVPYCDHGTLLSKKKEQYAALWDYCHELRRSNPGTTVKLQVIGYNEGEEHDKQLNPTFQRMYICFDACKKGFQYCRPVIGVDGCHLKGLHGGILLSAVGRDPNEEYFPIAFAVVEAENKDSWHWFINLLLRDLGTQRKYTWTSDQQKGLDTTLKELQPGCEHGLCCRHLYNNLRKKHPGLLIREKFWFAAYASYTENFNTVINELRTIDSEAAKWVEGVPKQLWSRHAFTDIEGYVLDWFKVETYRKCYAPLIYPTNGPNMWSPTGYPAILPPQQRRPARRPKKLRRREPDEPKKGSKLRRSGFTVVCQRCKRTGHNKRTCKGVVGGNREIDRANASQSTPCAGQSTPRPTSKGGKKGKGVGPRKRPNASQSTPGSGRASQSTTTPIPRPTSKRIRKEVPSSKGCPSTQPIQPSAPRTSQPSPSAGPQTPTSSKGRGKKATSKGPMKWKKTSPGPKMMKSKISNWKLKEFNLLHYP